jgi:hypothetical protein
MYGAVSITRGASHGSGGRKPGRPLDPAVQKVLQIHGEPTGDDDDPGNLISWFEGDQSSVSQDKGTHNEIAFSALFQN